jgi:hypothetical protein
MCFQLLIDIGFKKSELIIEIVWKVVITSHNFNLYA